MRINAKYLLCTGLVAAVFAPSVAKANSNDIDRATDVPLAQLLRSSAAPTAYKPTATTNNNFGFFAAYDSLPRLRIAPTRIVRKADTIKPAKEASKQSLAKENLVIMQAEEEIFDESLGFDESIGDDLGFSIDIEDGEHIAGNMQEFESEISDIDISQLDITTRFTGLNVERSLGVDAKLAIDEPSKSKGIVFSSHWNYPDYIRRAEIRVFRPLQNTSSQPYKVVPIERGMPSIVDIATLDENLTELRYVLRVYAKNNKRYDETEEKIIQIPQNIDNYIAKQKTALGAEGGPQFFDSVENAFEAAKATAQIGGNVLESKIRIDGGQIAVIGREVPNGYSIYIDGVKVNRDENGDFAYNTILKSGEGKVTIDVLDQNGNGVEVEKLIEVPDSDLFYVALGDLTIGKNFTDGFTKNAGNEDYDDEVKLNGRLAMFLRGKIKGKYLITARADTGDEELEDILRNIDNKDYRNLFRRIDPDKHYPVYGDESTTSELAPSQGKLYVRLDYNDSHAMFGNFNTNIKDVELSQIDRSLFGGKIAFRSDAVTSFGENYINLDAFAATPGTIAARDSLRGTGGSLYFLRNTDITQGSDKIRLEIRDKDTGIVKSVRNLTIYEDYDIDYIQGRVILSAPLPSFADDSHLVQAGNLAGDSVHLVATYEYTPLDVDLDEVSYGGRASVWLHGGHLKIGGSAYKETVQANLDKEQYGADVTLRYSKDDSNNTYLKFEAAQTNGQSLEQFNSADGGFDFFTNNPTGFVSGGTARAYRAETHIDLSDGDYINGYWQQRESGFGALGQFTADEIEQFGGEIGYSLGEKLNLVAEYDETKLPNLGQIKRNANADIFYNITPQWRFGVGGGFTQVENANSANNTQRFDVAGELRYTSQDDYQAYVFGQTTVETKGNINENSRAGAGFVAPISDDIRINAEVSDGDGGLGAKAGIDYQHNDATRLYLAYDLAEQSNFGTFGNSFGTFGNAGKLTLGSRHRYSDRFSIYAEERLNHRKGDLTGLTQAYGFDFKPMDKWNINASFEKGEIDDVEKIKRTGGSLTIGYSDVAFGRDVSFSVTGEYRKDKTTANNVIGTLGTPQTTETYLGRAAGSLDLNESLKLQAKADAAFSENQTGGAGASLDFFKGEFVEASAGIAYRPIDNDKFNALVKYSYFYDLPTAGQQNNLGNVIDYKQKSHIVSADFIYDVHKYVSIGAKYGYKTGEVTSGRDQDDWQKSDVHLGVLRADLHLVNNWDAMVEGRVLKVEQAEDMESGVLVAVYRHLGENVKVGVGYNFCKFDDDLTDVSLDKEGAFLNVIGKF